MALKYILTLRSSSSPHLYLDTIKEMIKDDDELMPQTEKALLLMKRYKKSFVQLPLQMEVVISPEHKCNLERGLSPALSNFTKTDWSDKMLVRYNANKKIYLLKVKETYVKMGYDVKEDLFDDTKIPAIIKSITESENKLMSKIGKKDEKPV